jgi:hypothetical protein
MVEAVVTLRPQRLRLPRMEVDRRCTDNVVDKGGRVSSFLEYLNSFDSF